MYICNYTKKISMCKFFLLCIDLWKSEITVSRSRKVIDASPSYIFLSHFFLFFFSPLSFLLFLPPSFLFHWLFHSKLHFAQFSVPTDNLLHTITFRSTTYPLSVCFTATLFCFPLQLRIFIDYRFGNRSGLESFAAETQYVKCEALHVLVSHATIKR